MKIWNAFSGDHSMKLKIVGEFKEVESAKLAGELINELLELGENIDPRSIELRRINEKHQFYLVNDEKEIENLQLFYPVEVMNKKIEITTDDIEIQPLLKALLHYGAKIELFSGHNYPDKYFK